MELGVGGEKQGIARFDGHERELGEVHEMALIVSMVMMNVFVRSF